MTCISDFNSTTLFWVSYQTLTLCRSAPCFAWEEIKKSMSVEYVSKRRDSAEKIHRLVFLSVFFAFYREKLIL